VVGHPRSGSSLIEQILASHSKVFGAGEITDVGEIRVRLSQLIQTDSPRHMQRHWHRQQANLHLARLAMRAPGAHRVIDKMLANIFNLGLIAILFPKARIIYCRRDPRDTGLSCFFQLFENYNLLFTYDLADCAAHQREIDRLTAHWKRVVELRTLDVDYEQLIANPQEQTRRLIDFVGLDREPNCLEFHKTDRPVLTRSFWQVRQPIYTQSINRWKNYERHLGPLAALVRATA
jgi:hypothetical protein